MLKILGVIWLSIVSCFSFSSIGNDYNLKEIEYHQLEEKNGLVITNGSCTGFYFMSFQELATKIPSIIELPNLMVSNYGYTAYRLSDNSNAINDLPSWYNGWLQDVQYDNSVEFYFDLPTDNLQNQLCFENDFYYMLTRTSGGSFSYAPSNRAVSRIIFKAESCPIYPNYYTKRTVTFCRVNSEETRSIEFFHYFGDVFTGNVYTTDDSNLTFYPTVNYEMYESDAYPGAYTCPCLWFSPSTPYYEAFQIENDDYIQAYHDGYNTGFSVSQDSWYNAGYESGLAQGINQSDEINYNNGYNAGYSQGIIDSGSTDPVANSIFNGIFQVGLLPVNVFLEIFNFEVFGINISGFVSGLLTISVVMIVIRFLFGGKNDK